MVAYVGDGALGWFENTDGLGTFGPRKLINTNATISLAVEDIDGDGFKDIVTTFRDKNFINYLVWHRNITFLGTTQLALQDIQIAPNPAHDFLSIQHNNIPLQEVVLYNIYGQVVLRTNQNFHAIEVAHLASGVYFVYISTANARTIKKFIKD